MTVRDAGYARDMLVASRALLEMLAGRRREDLDDDVLFQSAVYWQICVLGEASNHLSAEFRELYPDTPWHEISGMRNRLIHGYRDINNDTLWEALHAPLRTLANFLSRIGDEDVAHG